MNTERWAYVSSCERLLAIPVAEAKDIAFQCLADWARIAERQNLADAACWYLARVVIPQIMGQDRKALRIEPWVTEMLFPAETEESMVEKVTVQEFLKAFPGTVVVGLSDVKDKPGANIEKAEWEDSFVGEALRARYGLFFVPNGLGTQRTEKGFLRSDLNVNRWNALFADYDQGKGDEVLRRFDAFCPPSIVVETKKGYHAYWMLEEKSAEKLDEATWRKLEQEVIKAVGADPAASNPSRLLRLPWTWHCKDEVPFMVRLVRFTARRYDVSEFARNKIGLEIEAESYRSEAQKTLWRQLAGAPKKFELRELPAVRLGEGTRHGTAKEEVARLYAGIDKSLAPEARRKAVEWYAASCEPLKPRWEKEIKDVVDWIERREFGGVVSS